MALSNEEPYEYLPITNHDGIRLIVLHPSPDKAAIVQCEIIHTTLQQARVNIYDHYTALSYVWGDANDMTTISVDGRPLRITTSLECALQHLRDTKRALNIWADGVSINQQNEAEKGKQVQQMGNVYETATHTVIFLGEGERPVESLLSHVLSKSEGGIFTPLGEDEEIITALNYLLQSPWFYRVWIFQELVLSKDPMIQYGQVRLHWNLFCGFTYFVKSQLQMTKWKLKGLNNVLLSSERKSPPQERMSLQQKVDVVLQMNAAKFEAAKSLLERALKSPPDNLHNSEITKKTTFRQLIDILVSRRGFGVSDPRDMIYAHLGLIAMPVLEVDYEKTAAQIFEMLVEQYIVLTDDFSILAYITDTGLEKCQSELATWAIDWTLHITSTSPRHMNLIDAVDFDTSRAPRGIKDDECSYHFGTSVLRARARVVSNVRNLSDTLDTTSYIPYHTEWLVAKRPKFGYPQKNLTEVNSAMSWLTKQVNENQEVVDTLTASLHVLRVNPYEADSLALYLSEEIFRSLSSGQSLLDGRRLASLRNEGRYEKGCELALVPASTKVGDLVCFLEAYNEPLVIRRLQECCEGGSKSEGLHVNLVGQCLVDKQLSNSIPPMYFHRPGSFAESDGDVDLLSIH